MAHSLLLLNKQKQWRQKMFNIELFTKNEEERIKQLSGIANLHISIARELMTCDRPLSREEMESLLELLITANEAKHLAHKLKSDVKDENSA
jgi:hypothetical protein